MATQLKLRRGTTAQHSTFTGAEGEVTVDTTKDTLVVHDGTTVGGKPLLPATDPNYAGTLTGGAGVVNLGAGQFYKDASGNISLGKTTANSRFNVNAGDNATTTYPVRVDNNANNYGTGFGAYGISNRVNATNQGIDYTFDIGGDAIFKTANVERMRITSAGTVTATAFVGNGSGLTGISAGLTGARGQVFTSTGTFTVPTGVTSVKVTVTGGGGNGGNATGTGASAGGGGAGGTAIKYVTGLTPGGTVAVTVGGIAGTSSFGAYCSATGGATAVTASAGGTSTAGGAGGAGSSGNINLNGGSGSAAGQSSVSDAAGSGGGTNQSSGLTAIVKVASGCCSATVYSYGQVGNGLIGTGGRSAGSVAPRNGGAATGFGNGGGGAIADGATDRTGGAGTAGIVIVEW